MSLQLVMLSKENMLAHKAEEEGVLVAEFMATASALTFTMIEFLMWLIPGLRQRV